MEDFDEYAEINKESRINAKTIAIIAGILVVVLAVALGITIFTMKKIKKDAKQALQYETVADEQVAVNATGVEDLDNDESMADLEESTLTDEEAVSEKNVQEANILTSSDVAEVSGVFYGIDVSKYQGVINWKSVANSGVDFAMIRVGLRTSETGEIKEDEFARYNLQEATANGIKVGVYFFSTAVNEAEAQEEAAWVVKLIEQYSITYPVGFNCEGFHNATSRQAAMSNEERTKCAEAFLNKVYESGYTPVFYASKNQLLNNQDWLTDELEKSYKVWISWYSESALAATGRPDYTGSFSMWQYTDDAWIDGVKRAIDKDVSYFGYEAIAKPHNETAPVHVEADYEAMYNFTETNLTVTAKEETNLRDIPEQGADSNILYTLKNGEIATVTATSDSGWSRVIFNGQKYYAVSDFLTTDLSGQSNNTASQNATTSEAASSSQTEAAATQPQNATDGNGGIKTVFTQCNEQVTPKIEINLRLLPSVTDPNATIVATVKNGEVFTRTGINKDVGWSRVVYNGQVLYCVSSYLNVVQ